MNNENMTIKGLMSIIITSIIIAAIGFGIVSFASSTVEKVRVAEERHQEFVENLEEYLESKNK